MLFEDSWEREVINDIRVVLIVDVLRPVSFRLCILNEVERRQISMDDEMRQTLFARLAFQAAAKTG